ncbi:MAG: DNA polymerase III subunit delta' [Pseudomonadota bacterium]
MTFDLIHGQEKAIGFLKRVYERGRLPHALLFTGIDGIGKRLTAYALASLLQCAVASGSNACGNCPACKKIASGNHPDFFVVEASGAYIKIDQIRALRKDFALKPFEGKCKVAIIVDAHLMRMEAANALLKITEEPPPDSFLILTAHQVSDVLPTIASRCQHVEFAPLPFQLIMKKLMENKKLDNSLASAVAAYANGSMGAAIETDAEKVMEDRLYLIEKIENLSISRLRNAFDLAAWLDEKKDDMDKSLEMLKSWIRDLVLTKMSSQGIINQDLAEKISIAAARYSISNLASKLKIIQDAQIALTRNLNRRSTLEVMLIRMCRVDMA